MRHAWQLFKLGKYMYIEGIDKNAQQIYEIRELLGGE